MPTIEAWDMTQWITRLSEALEAIAACPYGNGWSAVDRGTAVGCVTFVRKELLRTSVGAVAVEPAPVGVPEQEAA